MGRRDRVRIECLGGVGRGVRVEHEVRLMDFTKELERTGARFWTFTEGNHQRRLERVAEKLPRRIDCKGRGQVPVEF